ncbi:unnamed protein product, partial [marine sediment metagenome]
LFDALTGFYRRGDLPGFIGAGGHVQQWLDIQEGILPTNGQSVPEAVVVTKRSIAQNYSVRLYVDVKAWSVFRWNLPSNGVAYELCGHIWHDEGRGCLRVEEHRGRAGKIYVRRVAATCFRAQCPICYQKWAAREAGQIEDKFKRISRNNAEAEVQGLGRPIHVVISVPEVDAHLINDDYPRLKAIIYAIAGRVGIDGGASIFHPFANEKMGAETPEKILIDKSTGDFDLDSLRSYYAKMNKNIRFWYVRPHFHLLCYAPRDWDDPENDALTPEKIKAVYEETGYVVKNLGVRDSVRQTAHYQLSHCGVKEGYQTVSWFGELSNRNYHTLNPLPKTKPRKPRCPECNAELEPVVWEPATNDNPWINVDGQWIPRYDSEFKTTPSPLAGYPEGGFWIDPGGWRYLKPGEKLHSCRIQRPKKT